MGSPRSALASAFGVLFVWGLLDQSGSGSARSSVRDIGSAPGSAPESAFLRSFPRKTHSFDAF